MGNKSKTRTSWREKLETQNQEAVIHKCLIPRHLDVESIIRKVPQGKLITNRQIRNKLTGDYNVDFTCAKVIGISIWIIANAAKQDLQSGKKQITPYWRVVTKEGSLKYNFPGGTEVQAAYLEEEGYTIIPGIGKKPPKVRDFEKYLIEL